MRKLLLCVLGVSGSSVYAINNAAFQEFDNQYNTGYSYSQMSLKNGANNVATQNNQTLSLDVEKLFDMGVWFDVNANMVLSQSTSNLGGTGMGGSGISGQPGMPTSQNPNFGGVNAKVGYAIPVVENTLQVTPYALAGRNTNLAMSTIVSNGYNNVTNDYFYSGGIGARIEWIISDAIMLYGDQSYVYNWDQSGPTDGSSPQNVSTLNTVIGAKFNVYQSLQLGLNGFYTNYQNQSLPPAATPSNNGGSQNGNLVTIYKPTDVVGGMVTVGLTY